MSAERKGLTVDWICNANASTIYYCGKHGQEMAVIHTFGSRQCISSRCSAAVHQGVPPPTFAMHSYEYSSRASPKSAPTTNMHLDNPGMVRHMFTFNQSLSNQSSVPLANFSTYSAQCPLLLDEQNTKAR